MAKDKPSNFDWVSVRQECSTAKVFELLYLEARRNVETRNASLGEHEYKFELANSDGIFSVIRRSRFGGSGGVRFILGGEEISVESQGVEVRFTATLTLNDDGECRLLVEGEQLDRWQVLRRALEPLMFGSFK